MLQHARGLGCGGVLQACVCIASVWEVTPYASGADAWYTWCPVCWRVAQDSVRYCQRFCMFEYDNLYSSGAGKLGHSTRLDGAAAK